MENKRSLFTYEECEKIWEQFNRIPEKVSLKKTHILYMRIIGQERQLH